MSIVYADTSLFKDVANDAWYAKDVQFVAGKGLMNGEGDEFKPDDYVTRSELAAILNRFYAITDNETKIANTIVNVLPLIVKIDCGKSYGSGIIVSDNLALTANHVTVTDNVKIKLYNNNTIFNGKVIAKSIDYDLSLIQTDKSINVSSKIKFGSIKVGESVLSIGNPAGVNFTVTKGIISAFKYKEVNNNKLIRQLQFDAATTPGGSGGGLFNVDGELVGMFLSYDKKANDISYAIDAEFIKQFLKESRISLE
jgi:S1-C subfamily serine protease